MHRRSSGSDNPLQLTLEELERTERANNRATKARSKLVIMDEHIDHHGQAGTQAAQLLQLQPQRLEQQQQQQQNQRGFEDMDAPHTFYHDRAAGRNYPPNSIGFNLYRQNLQAPQAPCQNRAATHWPRTPSVFDQPMEYQSHTCDEEFMADLASIRSQIEELTKSNTYNNLSGRIKPIENKVSRQNQVFDELDDTVSQKIEKVKEDIRMLRPTISGESNIFKKAEEESTPQFHPMEVATSNALVDCVDKFEKPYPMATHVDLSSEAEGEHIERVKDSNIDPCSELKAPQEKKRKGLFPLDLPSERHEKERLSSKAKKRREKHATLLVPPKSRGTYAAYSEVRLEKALKLFPGVEMQST